MKKHLLPCFLFAAACLATNFALGQTELAPDQNPNYTISRAKYMNLADSLNEWHSTTTQDTYKAIDWLADRQEAREDRREFRRQLRLERAKWYGYNDYPAYPSYYYPRNHYNYYGNHYRRHRSYNYWWGLNFMFH